MNILITGGTGFIGSHLCDTLDKIGHSLIVLTRNKIKAEKKLPKNIQFVHSFSEIKQSTDVNAIVNLAGEGIADKRWSKERKKVLEESRIDLTADLIVFIRNRKQRPNLLISSSAVGYYGDSGDDVITEFTEPHEEFSHRLCAAWESQALRAKAMDVRVSILRTGLVIGKNGGFIKKLLPSFKLGFGAQLADGQQWMSWIHLRDYLNIILFLIDNEQTNGIYNATAPIPVNNRTFTKTLASVLHRPALLTLPKSVLNMLFGEMSRLLVTGQRVLPKKLQEAGFKFEYTDLKPALEDVCK